MPSALQPSPHPDPTVEGHYQTVAMWHREVYYAVAVFENRRMEAIARNGLDKAEAGLRRALREWEEQHVRDNAA